MKTHIRKIGGSAALILNPDFLKYYQLKVGDWVDISDIVKVND